MSQRSFASVETDELMERMQQEEGMYAWCRKGLEDYRVFWLGGSTNEDDEY